MKIVKAGKNDFREIEHFYRLVDKEFVPSLSERKLGIEGSVRNHLYNKNNGYFLAKHNDTLVSVIGFKKNWRKPGIGFISFLAVHPEYRKKGIAFEMNRFAMDYLEKEGMKRAYLKTSSINKAVQKIAEYLGFKEFMRIKNRRGPGIDTIYFRKELELKPI